MSSIQRTAKKEEEIDVISKLPSGILQTIFKYLKDEDLKSCSSLCRNFYKETLFITQLRIAGIIRVAKSVLKFSSLDDEQRFKELRAANNEELWAANNTQGVYEAFNGFLNSLCRKPNQESRDNIKKLLIVRFCEEGKLEAAEQFIELRTPTSLITSEDENWLLDRLVTASIKKGDFTRAERTIKRMSHTGHINQTRFSLSLVEGLREKKRYEQAHRILAAIPRDNADEKGAIAFEYCKLVEDLLANEKFDEAIKIVKAFPDELAGDDKKSMAKKIFYKLKNAKQYFRALSVHADILGTLQLYSEQEDKTINYMLHCAFEDKCLDDVEKILGQFGNHLSSNDRNRVYNRLVDALASAGDLTKAEAMIDKIDAAALFYKFEAMRMVEQAHRKRKNYEEALRVIKKMPATRDDVVLCLLEGAYGGLISDLCKDGELDRAIEVYNTIPSHVSSFKGRGIGAHEIIQELTQELTKRKQYKRAITMLGKMPEDPKGYNIITRDKEIVKILKQSIYKEGPQILVQILAHMQRANLSFSKSFHCQSVVEYLVNRNLFRDAEMVIKATLSDQKDRDKCYSIIVSKLRENGNLKEAERVGNLIVDDKKRERAAQTPYVSFNGLNDFAGNASCSSTNPFAEFEKFFPGQKTDECSIS